MKDVGFKYIDIAPAVTMLDFVGQAHTAATTATATTADEPARMDGSIALRGDVVFALGRPVKIRGMSVKFKGVVSTNAGGTALETPLLPKLKQALFGKSTLPAGEHVVPFLLEVPNIYPPSLALKRASIEYRVEVSVAIGLQKKSLTASHPVELRRHLLRCKEMAPLVETQIFEDTIPAKFHYAIDAPQIVCREQGSIPVAVKYLCFASQKPVRTIRTQLRQVELYSPDARGAGSSSYRRMMQHTRGHKRYVKRTVPALLHTVAPAQEKSTWKHPLVLRHQLQPLVTPTVHAPLVSVYHELEITFQFEHQFEDIKARIPIVVASIPPRNGHTNSHGPALPLVASRMPQYHFEMDQARLHDSCISVVVEKPARVREVHPVEDSDSLLPGSAQCNSSLVLGEPRLPVTSSSINLQRYFSPDDDHHGNLLDPRDRIGRSIRKFASANELSSLSHDDNPDNADDDDRHLPFPLERPRTTTPIAQRRKGGGARMSPIDVDLANGLKAHAKRTNNMAAVDMNLMKSKALLQQVQRQRAAAAAAAAAVPADIILLPPAADPTLQPLDDGRSSIGSDNTSQSSRRPHSMNSISSADDSPIDDQLRTRPPSIVFATAPGLPAETALRPQEAIKTSLLEESFVPSCDLSPLATIASSTLLSPRTSLALRKRRASAHGIPLSTAIGARESSVLDHDGEILRRIACSQQRLPSQPPPPRSPLPPVPPLPEAAVIRAKEAAVSAAAAPPPPPTTTTVAAAATYTSALPPPSHPPPPPPPPTQQPPPPTQQPPAEPNPYTYLELPPLPRRANNSSKIDTTTRRMTKLYVDDSDDEVLDPLPPIPERYLPRSPSSSSSSTTSSADRIPPTLPRLSLGTEFGISFE